MLERISKIKEIYGKSPGWPVLVKQFRIDCKRPAIESVKRNATLRGWP
jgi:hypothetical protein